MRATVALTDAARRLDRVRFSWSRVTAGAESAWRESPGVSTATTLAMVASTAAVRGLVFDVIIVALIYAVSSEDNDVLAGLMSSLALAQSPTRSVLTLLDSVRIFERPRGCGGTGRRAGLRSL